MHATKMITDLPGDIEAERAPLEVLHHTDAITPARAPRFQVESIWTSSFGREIHGVVCGMRRACLGGLGEIPDR